MSDINQKETTPFTTYIICTQDSDCEESWARIESQQDLASMDEDELRVALGDTFIIGDEDRVFVAALDGIQKLSLTKP